MVIRFDNNRVKEVVNRTVDPIGVDGDPATHAGYGVSEADKIVEGARKSMASTEITDEAESAEKIAEKKAEKVTEKILQKMGDDGPGPDVPMDEPMKTPPKNVESSNGST
jgi:protein phosphatase PTC1